jgi:hypothetical protein
MAARKTIVVLVALACCAALVAACRSGGRGTALRRCPVDLPAETGSTSPGTEGDAVPRGSVAALICRWVQPAKGPLRRSEATVRGWPADRLARTLDELPPSEFEEGAYSCESAEPSGYLIGFDYPDGTGEQVEVTSFCGMDAVNRRTGKAYAATRGLEEELDRDLSEGR